MGNSWHIRGARLLDPSTGEDRHADLYIEKGRIVRQASAGAVLPVVEAHNLVLCPGFVDLHVHFRQPGNEGAETIATGATAAARGGFTTVMTMPNTTPATDTPDMIAWTRAEASRHGKVLILPSGCLTVGRKGTIVADIEGMAKAGARAFTDDGSTITDPAIMESAMRQAVTAGLPIMDHALDPILAAAGVIREGRVSARLGLMGIPPEAEIRIVRRDIDLCSRTRCHTHIQHLFASGSLPLIRDALRSGLPVSAEATPHHLALTDEDIPGDDSNYKMNPPLGSPADRDALVEAVADGTIQVLATDHAPHLATEKAKGFIRAPFGVIGLETAIGITYSVLVGRHRMPLLEWIRRWTTGPARVLGLPAPSLEPNSPANLVLMDLHTPWAVNANHFVTRSRNTPFGGWQVTGRAVCTFLDGFMVWDDRKVGIDTSG